MNVPQVMKLQQLTHNLMSRSRSRSTPSPATSDKYLGFFIFLLARIITNRGEKVAYQRWKNILYVHTTYSPSPKHRGITKSPLN